jgi:hypothetical protein
METLKQSALTAISQLPDTANLNHIQAVFKRLESQVMPIHSETTKTEGISAYELAKDLLGTSEGPAALSTRQAQLLKHGGPINQEKFERLLDKVADVEAEERDKL